jgi:hypothetical protein
MVFVMTGVSPMNPGKLFLATFAAVMCACPSYSGFEITKSARPNFQETDRVAQGHGLIVTLDETGILRDSASQLQGPLLIQKMQQSAAGVKVVPTAAVSMRIIQETAQTLHSEGIKDFRVAGFVARGDILFATWGLNLGEELGHVPPWLAIENERLSAIAKSSGAVRNLPDTEKPLLYHMFMNETGEIIDIEQVRGPRVPAVEEELMRTPVIRPGIRGLEPVPMAFLVEVDVQ